MPRWITRTSPSSSRAKRYFPRRSTPVNFFPSSRLMNCLRLWCRRTVRIPSTSTAFTRLPTSSRSRSRRTTSTSGSSGIGLADRAGGERGCVLARLRFEALPRDARRGLLGLLLGAPLPDPVALSPQRHRGVEPLRVVRAVGAHLVPRQLIEAPRRELLQAGLEVVTAGA